MTIRTYISDVCLALGGVFISSRHSLLVSVIACVTTIFLVNFLAEAIADFLTSRHR